VDWNAVAATEASRRCAVAPNVAVQQELDAVLTRLEKEVPTALRCVPCATVWALQEQRIRYTLIPRVGSGALLENHMAHVVERKLGAIIPLIVAGKMLPEQRVCRVQRIYAFGNDLFTALATLGLGPAAAAISKAVSGDAHAAPALADSGGKAEMSLWQALLSLPTTLGMACLLLILAWIVTKVWLHQLDPATITTLSLNAAQECRLLEAKLEPILDAAKPMPELNVLHNKLHELRNASITNKIWSWDLLPTDSVFMQRCRDRIAALVMDYSARWAPADDPDART
jgi:hypothetical protein